MRVARRRNMLLVTGAWHRVLLAAECKRKRRESRQTPAWEIDGGSSMQVDGGAVQSKGLLTAPSAATQASNVPLEQHGFFNGELTANFSC